MATKKSEPVSPSERESSANFHFKDADDIFNVIDDADVGDTVTVTVTGKIESISSRSGKESYANGSDLEIKINSISGKSKRKAESDSELEDSKKGEL